MFTITKTRLTPTLSTRVGAARVIFIVLDEHVPCFLNTSMLNQMVLSTFYQKKFVKTNLGSCLPDPDLRNQLGEYSVRIINTNIGEKTKV